MRVPHGRTCGGLAWRPAPTRARRRPLDSGAETIRGCRGSLNGAPGDFHRYLLRAGYRQIQETSPTFGTSFLVGVG